LVGKPLVITEVKGEKVVDTSRGEATAVVIDVLVLDSGTPNGFPGDDDYSDGAPELKHIPDVLIFWSVVQRQLLSDDFRPPVAGKFAQAGKAYTLDPLTESELAAVQALI
jgi:hypothetical protein